MTRKLVILIVLLAGFSGAGLPASGTAGTDKSAAHIVSSHDPPADLHFSFPSHGLHEHGVLRPYKSESYLHSFTKNTFPFPARVEQEPNRACFSIVSRQERKKLHSFLENPWIGTDVQMTARLQVFHLHLQTYPVPPDERDAPGRRSDDPRAGPGHFLGIPTERFA